MIYASKTLHERCDRQLMVVLDTEFFGKSKKDDFVSVNCFKVVIKALCKSGKVENFREVQSLMQKMDDLEIKPDGTILSSILQSEWCDSQMLATLPLTVATCTHAFKFVKTNSDLDNCFEMYDRLSQQ